MPKNTVLELINKSAPPIDIVKGIIDEMLAGEFRFEDLLIPLAKTLKISKKKDRFEADELFKETIQILNERIQNDDVCSMVFLGFMYKFGMGCDVDNNKAIVLYDNAIRLDNASAMTNRANMHLLGKGCLVDNDKAIALYENAIYLGDASAMSNRAYMHMEGKGGPINYAKAIDLYEKAIKLGCSMAMSNRAYMHKYGQGGPIDYAKAIALYDKAISLGHSIAMNNRACMHRFGQGGSIDNVKAIALYEKATSLGDETPKNHLQGLQLEEHAQNYLKALWPTLNAGATVSQTSLDFMSKSKTIKQAIVEGVTKNSLEMENKLLTLEAMLSNDNHPLALVLQKGSAEYMSLEKYYNGLVDEQKAISSSEINDHVPPEIVQHIQFFLLGKPSAQVDAELGRLEDKLASYLASVNRTVKNTCDLFHTPHIIAAFVQSLSCHDNQSCHFFALWLLKSIQEFGSLDKPNTVHFKSPKVSSLLEHLRHRSDFIQHCQSKINEKNEDSFMKLLSSTEHWLKEGMTCRNIDDFLIKNIKPIQTIESSQDSMIIRL